MHTRTDILLALSRALVVTCALALGACKYGGGGGGSDGAKPQIRLLNLSSGYSSLDLLTNIDADTNDDDATQASGVNLENVSAYASLKADNYTVKLRRTGAGSILRSFAGEQLTAGAVFTYVAYGEVGSFSALKIDESLDPPDAGQTHLNVANVSSAGNLDVYLTDASTDLNDTTPVLSNVGAGLVSLTTNSGTYRLRATAAGDTSDVRLDIPAFTLADKGIGTFILTSTQGGELANGIYLPQQGQPARFANTKARVRGAVGAANGAPVTIQAGGKSILSAATAGVIGSRYTVLDAGDVPVTLVVNGSSVTVPDITLGAGADYTLLVWSGAQGPQASLIVDDNRLPANGGAKLRLLNGMSTLAAPLTLAVDFSPVIEGTPLGEASDAVEITSGTDRQFDITNATTAASVLTRTAITLQASSVYTFFMTDNGATPIGVLRRDR